MKTLEFQHHICSQFLFGSWKTAFSILPISQLQIKFSEFVARHIGEAEGVILEAESGDFLGKHRGFWFYTIGQRQGLRLPGGPWYDSVSNLFIHYLSRLEIVESIYQLSRCFPETKSFSRNDKLKNSGVFWPLQTLNFKPICIVYFE